MLKRRVEFSLAPAVTPSVAGSLVMTLVFLTLFLDGYARAQVIPNGPETTIVAGSDGSATITPSKVGQLPPPEIPTNERLEYQISWLGVPVALLTMTTSPVSDKEDILKLTKDGFHPQSLLKLDCQARTNTYLETVFPIRVQLVSFLDPRSRNPRRFEAFIKRQQRRHESVEIFHTEKGEAFHQLPKGRSATVAIGPATQDGLSLLYYVRTIPFRVGQEIPLEVSAAGRNWQLNSKIVRTGTVQIKNMKEWPAIAGEAELANPLPFFGVKALVWFSANQERIPLLATINSNVGPVTVVLTRRTAGEPL